MITLTNCWRIWSSAIDGDSLIYGITEQHCFYLTSRVQRYEQHDGYAIAQTLDGEVKLIGKVTRLKASEAVFRKIQTGLTPEEAIKVGKTRTPTEARIKLEGLGEDNE